MSKVIGIRNSSFKGNDGAEVKGVNIYFTDPLENGSGYAAERVFVTEQRLQETGYKPQVGDEISVNYNRFGKVSSIVKINK